MWTECLDQWFPTGALPPPGGRLLASGGRCKGRGAVVGVEKRWGGRGALNENLFEHI